MTVREVLKTEAGRVDGERNYRLTYPADTPNKIRKGNITEPQGRHSNRDT